jgi:sugar lactone lactonase YvrE
VAALVAGGLASCTNTANEPVGYTRNPTPQSEPVDAGVKPPGYLWFAGSYLNAFTQDQTQASSDKGPAVTVIPSALTATFHDLVFDPAGNLWTIPITGDQILRIPRLGLTGDLRPQADLTITSTALKGPQALAFDAAGNLWVVNYAGAGPATANIVRFDGIRNMSRGTVDLTPSATIGPGTDKAMIARFTQGTALAFDSSGSLWFGAASNVMRFDAPSTLQGMVAASPTAIISTGDAYASLAIDGVGALWITATHGGFFVLRYADPDKLTDMVTSAPMARVALPSDTATFAGGMAFDATGALWVAMSNQVVALAKPSSMVGNVSPGLDVVLGLPQKSYPDLASKLAFWPKPPGLPVF